MNRLPSVDSLAADQFAAATPAGSPINTVSKPWTMREVMTSPAGTVAENTPARELIRKMSDTAIRQDVETIVRDVLQLADCGLNVDHGTVSLEGRVNRKSEADRLLSLVARVPGVVAVHPEIQCEVDDTRSPLDLARLVSE
jgi:osmotically-inducible protein OsmY